MWISRLSSSLQTSTVSTYDRIFDIRLGFGTERVGVNKGKERSTHWRVYRKGTDHQGHHGDTTGSHFDRTVTSVISGGVKHWPFHFRMGGPRTSRKVFSWTISSGVPSLLETWPEHLTRPLVLIKFLSHYCPYRFFPFDTRVYRLTKQTVLLKMVLQHPQFRLSFWFRSWSRNPECRLSSIKRMAWTLCRSGTSVYGVCLTFLPKYWFRVNCKLIIVASRGRVRTF